MATASDDVVKSDHIIIWLDKNMGVPENNKSSKKNLDNNANLNLLPSDECLSEINRLICRIDPELNEETFDNLIKSPLRIFTDKNECMKCIHDNIQAKKRLFLITSGAMGALIMDEVHKILSGYIYVFCGQRALHEEKWARPYKNHIEIYDDEQGVFAKVLADIAIYYFLKGQKETENQTAAIQYLRWARRLFKSATKLDHFQRDDYLSHVNDELAARRLLQSSENDDNSPIQPDDGLD